MRHTVKGALPSANPRRRDRERLRLPTTGRAALIGDLRQAGGGERADGSVETALQPPADPAGAGHADAGGLRGGLPGAVSARLP